MNRFEVANNIIGKAGAMLRESLLQEFSVRQKSGPQDLVTDWDQRIETFLRKEIHSAFPNDVIVGEEYPPENNDRKDGSATWYLDPIDGTTNFISQRRNFAVSIGCWDGSQPLFGLVLDVERQILYWAKSGGGAWQNQTPLHVSSRRQMEELLLTTPGVQPTFLDEHPFQKQLLQLARKVRGVRCLGSVALEICEVATGRADLFVAMRSSPWDHNAARIILEEAGGAIFTMEGGPLPLDRNSTVLALNCAGLKGAVLNS